MAQIFLYAHGGSGNHGCEAIVRSTVKILNSHDITLISSNPEQDIQYGLDEICGIIKDTSVEFRKASIDFLKAYGALKLKKDFVPMDKLWYKESFDHIKKGDIAISIGGDNYCYADVNKYVMLHDMMKDRGARTVLWGCSVEPEVVRQPAIAADIAKYDLITARESITYEALSKINPNTILVSDPAFQLGLKKTVIPKHFIVGNTVGINLSPMAIENETVSGLTWSNYTTLIDYIILETDLNIALIPHVVWDGGDDRIPLRKLYEKYKNTNRICAVEDHGCEELKYLISKCRFFVGARTHSTIAAYSTGVPTLVLGYSVKSKGIAKDLFGTYNGYLVSVQSLGNPDALCRQFKVIVENEIVIKKYLLEIMPQYISKGLVDIAGMQ